jgi:crossover junction endodeoxyribonuclease RusA
MATWTCFVPGTPRATQTGTVVRAGGRLIPIRRNTGYANLVKLAANQAPPTRFLEGPLGLRLDFILPRPTSGKAAKRSAPTVRPDLSNLEKGLTDALEGIVFANDAQVCRLAMQKGYGVRPGVTITVEELDPLAVPRAGGAAE